MSSAEFLSYSLCSWLSSHPFPMLLYFLLSQNWCFIQMEQNIYLKSIVIEITEQVNGEDQLGNPNSFILWMTKPWPIKERSFQDHSLATQSTRHQSCVMGKSPEGDLFCPICRGKRWVALLPCNTVKVELGVESQLHLSKKGMLFHIADSQKSYLLKLMVCPLLPSLLASSLTHKKNVSPAMTPGCEPISVNT